MRRQHKARRQESLPFVYAACWTSNVHKSGAAQFCRICAPEGLEIAATRQPTRQPRRSARAPGSLHPSQPEQHYLKTVMQRGRQLQLSTTGGSEVSAGAVAVAAGIDAAGMSATSGVVETLVTSLIRISNTSSTCEKPSSLSTTCNTTLSTFSSSQHNQSQRASSSTTAATPGAHGVVIRHRFAYRFVAIHVSFHPRGFDGPKQTRLQKARQIGIYLPICS